ncbi:MAG: hypothetical protein U1F66_10570 [bacterium]
MTHLPTILTADDLAARAQAEIESLPGTRLDTHVPAGADRVASRLHGRHDHFRLPAPSLGDLSRSGSHPSRPAGARRHEPVSGAFSFTGYVPVTRYHGTDREYRLAPHFEVGEAPRTETPGIRGGSRRERRVSELLTQATNLMGGAEVDVRLARAPGLSAERREEILTRARESYASAERLLRRAEGLARAGRIPGALREELSSARLRADTAEFGMRA